MKIARLSLLAMLIILSSCSREKFIEGAVIDYDTGRPVAGVRVTANQTGWDFSDLAYIKWDKNYVFESITDAKGHFRIVYDVNDSAHIRAEMDGYSSLDSWFKENSSVVIKLKAKDPNYVPQKRQMVEIGFKRSRPYGWIFAEKRITFDADEADLFPGTANVDERFKGTFELLTSGRGGLVFVSAEEMGVNSDLLLYADMAPEEGYVSSVLLAPKSAGSAGVYFVRARDGRGYAKFEFNPKSFSGLGSPKDFKKGTWGLALNALYNDHGTRNLRFQR